MPRPPLVIGTWGVIRREQKAPRHWVAFARFRDFDGVTRKVERTGTTGREAEDTLKEALLNRAKTHGEEITLEATMRSACELWFTDEIEGAKAYNTERRYREVLDLMVLPGLGMLRLREISVARCDRFVKTITKTHGPSAAKHARTVLSGVLGMATRLGVYTSNPIRDVATVKIETKEVETMTVEQVQRMRVLLHADDEAVLRDLPDAVDFMLGTSARIGEAMACRWVDIDLEATIPTVLIRGRRSSSRVRGPRSRSVRRPRAHAASFHCQRSLLTCSEADGRTTRGGDGVPCRPGWSSRPEQLPPRVGRVQGARKARMGAPARLPEDRSRARR